VLSANVPQRISFTMLFTLSSARLATPLRSAPAARQSAAARRPLALSVRAESSTFKKGQAVKVKEEVLVYHILKTKGAEVNLKGMTGVVDSVRPFSAYRDPTPYRMPLHRQLRPRP
jgi:hypothetical protein